MSDDKNKCRACGVNWEDHAGIYGTCKLLQRYKIALADAIRSPIGKIPDSAFGLVTDERLGEAEKMSTTDA